MKGILIKSESKEELISEMLIGIKRLLEEREVQNFSNKEWLTSKEVTSLLKITSVTLWNYDKQGLTKPQRIGRRKRYLQSDILAILQRKESKIQ
jgi:predicted DNA-binding transcriptional regulator AlpA